MIRYGRPIAVIYMMILIMIILSSIHVEGSTCSSGNRIPLHIRSIMTFESEAESGEHALFLESAADHINGVVGVLDDYYICFSWNHSRVSCYVIVICLKIWIEVITVI